MKHKLRLIISILCASVLCFTQAYVIGAEIEERMYIVTLKDDVSLFDSRESARITVLSEGELYGYIQAGLVESYEEDFIVELFDSDIAEDSGLKWDLDAINADEAAKISCEGQNIKVGVIDSGAAPHPDLVDSLCRGYNYLSKTTDVTDNIGHGTFVCGLIAANPNSADIVGVAHKADIVPLKCFDNGYTTRVSTICSAIYDAVDIYGCDIINMSLGVPSYSQTFEKAIKYAIDKGVIIVAAVGNYGTDELYYPAAFDGVIGVGSINENLKKSVFSQYNSSVFVVAPGEDVWSTSADGAYSQKSGTSFSTPLVSGMIAVMMNVEDGLDYDKITDYLISSSTDLGAEAYDTSYGYGMVDIGACIDLMLEGRGFFISPIEEDENSSFVTVFNNTAEAFDGYCFWGQYSKGCMKDMDWSYVELEPGDTVRVQTYIKDDKVKCFLWKDITDITVISNARESEDEFEG